MAVLWNYVTGKKNADQRSRHAGLQLLPQESVHIIERDRKDNKLGEGSYARVYLGKYLGKDRAVKVFNENIFSEKVNDEFERLNSLKHPNIVRVYGMWEDPHKGRNSLAIVMELCDGSLRDFIEQGFYKGISSEQKLKILHDITCAMVYLHSQSVIHGDLRTPNVLVNKTNTVVTAKLTDFGMARVLNNSNAHFTASLIDDDYLPPEVYNHDKYKNEQKNYARLTRQVDVFFFGPITIELTCGQFPKPGPKVEKKKGAVVRTFSEVERREKHLMMIKPGDRMYVDLIVEQCMADIPADRASFEELLLIVEGFQKKYDKRPDKEMLEEKQREVEFWKSAMEADQVTLNYEVHLEEIEKECERFKEEAKQKSEQLTAAEESLSKKDEACRELQEMHGKKMAEYGDLQQKHVGMEDDNTELQSLVKQSKQQCTALQKEKDELQSSLAIAQRHISTLETTVTDASRDSINRAKDRKDVQQRHKQEIEALKKAQQTVHENLQKELQLLEEEKKKIKMDLSAAQCTNSQHEKTLIDLRKDNTWSNTRIEQMETKAREAQAQAQGAKSAQEKMAEELRRMKKQFKEDLEQREEELKVEVNSKQVALSEKDTSQKKKERELKDSMEQLKLATATMKTNLDEAKSEYKNAYVEMTQDWSAKNQRAKEAVYVLLEDKQGKVKQAEKLAHQTRVAKEKMSVELTEKEELLKGAHQQLEEERKTLEVARKERDSLQSEKEQLTETAEKLQQEHMKDLLRRDEEIDRLEKSTASLNPQIATLTEEKCTIQAHRQEEQEAFSMQKYELEKQLAKAKEKAADFERSYETLNEGLTEQKSFVEKLQHNVAALREDNDRLEEANKCLTFKKNDVVTKDKHGELKKKLEESKKETRAKEDELKRFQSELKKKLDVSKQETRAKEDELKRFQSELKTSQTKARNLEQQLSGANQAKLKLENDKDSLKAKVQSKEKECSLLRSTETRLNKLKQDHEILLQNLIKTESELSQLKLEQSRTSSDMKGKDADLGKKQDSIRQLKSDLKEARDSLQASDVDIKKLKEEVKAQKEAFQFLERQLREEKMKNTSIKLQNQVKSLEGELQTSRVVAEQQKAENKTLEEKLTKARSDAEDILNKHDERMDEVERLKAARDELVKEKSDLASERDHFQKQNSGLNGERKSLQIERDNLVAEKGVLTSERDHLVGESSSLKVTEQSLRQERDSLVKDRDSLLQEKSAAMVEVETSFQQHEERKNEWETTNKDLGDKLESLELKLRLKEEELTQLRAIIEQNEVRIQDAKEALTDLEKYRKKVQELKITISELETKRNSQTTEESHQRQDIERPLLVKIKNLMECLSQREAELQSSNGRISELESDIDASKAHSAELKSELSHTCAELDTALAGLSTTRAELSNAQDGLTKAQEQNEASSIRCLKVEQQCQAFRQHIAELESAQSILQKREEDLNQQVKVLNSERDTAQRQAQDFDRRSSDFKLKLQKVQTDYENEEKNHEHERDTAKRLKTKNAQLNSSLSSREREVQALKEKSRHRREVMQQVVKLLQAQVAAVRSDLDQERSRQSDLKDSVELLLTQYEKMKLVILSRMHGKVEETKCAIRTSQHLVVINTEVEEENRQLVRNNDTLKKKLTNTRVEKEDLQSQCATLQEEKAMLTEQLNDCRVQISSLEQSNQRVTAEQRQVVIDIQNLQIVISSKEEDLRQFAEQVASLESYLEEMKTQNKELQGQLEAERNRCTDLDKDLGDMKESRESLLAKKMELTITLRAKVETVKAHDEELERKAIKIFELVKESSCHLEQLQTAASALETSESALFACRNELAASVDESRARGMKVEQLFADLSESKTQVTSLTEQLGTVTDDLSSTTKKLEDVEQNRDELKESLKAETATLDVSERKLAEATSKNEASEATIEELKSSWNACNERSKKTCKDLLQVEEQQRIQSEQLQKVKEEYSRMSIAKQQLEEKFQENFIELAECTDVRSKAQKVENECLKFKELAAQTEVQRKDLSADLSNKEQKLRQIVDAHETLQGKYMQVGKEKEEAEAHCAQLSEALAQAQEGHTALSADLRTMTAKYMKFRDENVNLEGILADLQVKNQSLQQTKDFLHEKNGEMKRERLLLKQVSEDFDSLKLVHESVKHRLADLQDKHIAVEGENRHLRKLKRAERELQRDQETIRKSMQEIKEAKLRLQSREEAFDGVKSIVAISQNIERKQERLQKQQSHIFSKAHAFAVGTQEKIGLSIEEKMQVHHQLFKQQCTAATEQIQLCMGNLPEQVMAAVTEHSTHLAQEKQEQLEQHMTDLVTGVVKTVTTNHTSSLAHMAKQCQELEEQLREYQQATKKGTNEVLTLQRRQLDETRNIADSSERGSENVCVVSPKVCCEIQSFQDVMIPYLLSLAYNHNFTDTKNTGPCTDISELEAVCDLKALTVIEIGSLDPRCASYLPSIHPYCTQTVITVIKSIWGVYKALPYQMFSFSYLHASDKVYMCRLLLAVVPRMLTNTCEKRLKSDILYTLARVPLSSALKLKVNMEALFSPRWHTGKDAQYLYQKYAFHVLPANVQCVADQLELVISRKLDSVLQISLQAANKN